MLTDVEGSTLHYASNRQKDMLAALGALDSHAAASVGRYGGRIIKDRGEGDSHFCVMPSVVTAVEAALDLQVAIAEESWPVEAPFRVRIGIHVLDVTGAPEDFYGLQVNAAFALRDLGDGGHVLLSGDAASSVRSQLPPSSSVQHVASLPVVPSVWMDVYQLRHPRLRSDPPTIRSTHVPFFDSELMGRGEEVATIGGLFSNHRGVTLHGAGGAGKTHLATVVAEKLAPGFRHGWRFVNLASARDTESAILALGAAIAGETSGGMTLRECCDALRDRHLLLLFDNCEQVEPPLSEDAAWFAIHPVAKIAYEILSTCPKVRILATSRERLDYGGEATFHVEGLAWPPVGSPVADLPKYAATRLFLDRARSHDAAFEASDEMADAISEIAAFLEGNPLGIRIAAAQVPYLTPQQVLDALTETPWQFRGTFGPGGERHSSLARCIAWSVDLLSEDELRAFEWLSTFEGPFSRDDALFLLANDPGGPRALARLVRASLVAPLTPGSSASFHVQPVLREFARQRLRGSADASAAAARHAAWCMDLASKTTGHGSESKRSVGLEHRDDFRAALEYLSGAGEWDKALDLAGRLRLYWFRHGLWDEGRRHLERLLESSSGIDIAPRTRAEALLTLGTLLTERRDPAAQRHLEKARALMHEAGDVAGEARCLNNLANLAHVFGDLANARRAYDEALTLKEAAGTVNASSYLNPGVLALQTGELDRARDLLAGAVELARGHESDLLGPSLTAQGALYCYLGDYDRADEILNMALDHLRGSAHMRAEAEALRFVAISAMEQERYDDALRALDSADSLDDSLQDYMGMTETASIRANVLLERGDAPPHLEDQLEHGVHQAVEADDRWVASVARLALVRLKFARGQPAHLDLWSAIDTLHGAGFRIGLVEALEEAAALLAEEDYAFADRLVTACNAERAATGAKRSHRRRAWLRESGIAPDDLDAGGPGEPVSPLVQAVGDRLN